jgi:hypothetical protein
MKVIGKVPEGTVIAPKDHLVTLTVTFGDPFCKETLTRAELIERLRSEAVRHPKSFLKQMMEHFAEHMEAAAEFEPSGKYALSAPASSTMDASYDGQGSCSGCTSDVSPPTCCSCTHDGITSCEPC